MQRSNRLARVRDNQRKSRARKQQYIEELEQKVAVCNAQAQQKEIEHLIALQKLEAENAKLRSLLLSRIGLTADFLDGFLKNESSPIAAEKIAIPRLQTATSPKPSTTTSSRCAPTTTANVVNSCSVDASKTAVTDCCNGDGLRCAQDSKVQSESHTTPTIWSPEFSAVMTPVDSVSTQPQNLPSTNLSNIKLPSIASLCDCGPDSMVPWPRSESPLGTTTLCEVAQDFIDQYNVRGVDINIIKQRLQSGFRNGDTAGCLVQNNLLFEVLDEISSGGGGL